MSENKYEIISGLAVEIQKSIPIEKVIGDTIPLKKRGAHYMGLCPFHPDEHLGSFLVTPGKNIWYCFAEEIGGGAVEYIKRYYGIRYTEAVLRLSLQYGLITEREHDRLNGKRYDPKLIKKIQAKTKVDLREMKEAYPKASPDLISEVYSIMAKVCSLDDDDRQYLRKERHLSDISCADYFSMPSVNENVVDKILLYVQEKVSKKLFGLEWDECNEAEKAKINGSQTVQDLRANIKYVPGFYEDEEGNILFITYIGIGFLVRNLDGRPVGIQIRKKSVKENEARYVWFSSNFAHEREGYKGGASAGSPGGIVFPSHTKWQIIKADKRKLTRYMKKVYVTEGKFKAEKIAEEMQAPVIYVSGVSTWKSITYMIEEFKQHGLDCIHVAFDADMMGNPAVHGQLASFCGWCHKYGIITYLTVWKKEYGKGFDDLANENPDYQDKIRYIGFHQFEAGWEKALDECLEKYNISQIRELDVTQRGPFTAELQSLVEESCGL